MGTAVPAETEPAPRRPGRPRARPVEVDRRAILDAARAVFAERGFDGGSIEAVAQLADVARPSVYEQFGSKERLIAATVEDAADLLTARLGGAFADDTVPWRDAVRETFTALFELVETDANAITLLFRAEQTAAVPEGSGFAGARRRVIEQLTVHARERWAGAGVELGTAAELISLMLFSMGEAVARRQVQEGLDRQALIDLLTAFTNGGLGAVFGDDQTARQRRAAQVATKRWAGVGSAPRCTCRYDASSVGEA